MANSTKRKYSELNLFQKKELIQFFESKRITKREVSAIFNVSPATVSNILKEKEKISKACQELEDSASVFRVKKPKTKFWMHIYLNGFKQNVKSNLLSVENACSWKP